MPPPLLTLRAAAVHLGARPLFAELTVAVGKGDRICLVGRNGSGKSTLLRTLAGSIELDRGERFLQPRATVAYLPQEPALDPEEHVLESALRGLPAGGDPDGARHRAEAWLARFELDPAQRIGRLSGGEARRVDLARVMVAEPDVLLLDEPTNHLDLPTIERLEEQLAEFPGGLVVVSHDRAFLSALGRTVWWLDRGRLRALDQGFAAFDEWSAEVLAREQAELAQLDRTIATETDWLRFGVTARRRRNQGRLRRLQTLRAERARRGAPQGRAKLAAATDPTGGRLVIAAEGITQRFGERLLIERFSTRILRGDRVGIVGPNGCGKTTLLKVLTGRLEPDEGTVRLGTNLSLAFVDQRRDTLDLDATPWDTLCPGGGDQVPVRGRSQHVVGYLRDFLFRPEQARAPIRALSGGERNRLLLAHQLARPANLLVLDEPTNDLDMETLDLLQEVLAEFEGTLLLVSHDRDFLDRLVTSVIAFEGGGRLQEYAGGYSDMLRQRPAKAPPPARSRAADRPKPRPTPQRSARRARRDLERLSGRVDALSGEVAKLEAELADPDLFRRDPRLFQQHTETLAERRRALEAAEAEWLEVALEVERSTA